VFRHGARSPLFKTLDVMKNEWDICKGVPYTLVPHETIGASREPKVGAPLRGGCYMGELSTLGYEQARALGERLRERLGDTHGLLDDGSLDAGAVETRTTNVPRTIATAAGVLTGLFPASVHRAERVRFLTAPEEVEHIVPNSRRCARLEEAMKDASRWQAGRGAELLERAHELIRQVVEPEHAEKLLRRPDLWPAVGLNDVDSVQQAHGTPAASEMPFSMTAEQRAELRRLCGQMAGLLFADLPGEKLRRGVSSLSSGRLLRDITGGLEARANSVDSRTKLRLFSAHDTTVLAVLLALRPDMQYTVEWPGYTASVAFELWAEVGEDGEAAGHKVGVLYNGEQLDLPCAGGDDKLCTLEEFVHSIAHLVTQDFARSCQPRGARAAAGGGGGDAQVLTR